MKKLQKKLYNKKYYSKNKKRFKSYYLKNKKKQLKASAQWKRDNPDKHRGHVYKSSYGITLEQYNKMFKRQNGECAICKNHQRIFKKRLSVDHDHKTGKIRGLLCNFCNVALGRFRDSTDILHRALLYLEVHK